MAKTYADLTVANATAGNAILATDFSTLFTNSNNYRRPPMCILKRDAYTLANGATDWVFDNASHEELDNDDMHSTSSNNTRITPTTAGVYVVTATILSGPLAADNVTLQVSKNGTAIAGTGTTTGAGTYAALVSVTGIAAANGTTDYFTAVGNPVTSRSCNVRFTAHWVGQAS